MIYRDAGVYGSSETDSIVKITIGGRASGASGQSSPVLAMSEASQPSIHQYISNQNSGASNNGPIRLTDAVPNNGNNNNIHTGNSSSSLTPSLNSQYGLQGSSFNVREEQSAADHVVLYTLLRELCNLRMALIYMYVTQSIWSLGQLVGMILWPNDSAILLTDNSSPPPKLRQLSVNIHVKRRY